jgi:UDP-3-O-[3-hydroxymyristoyl] N-acetylglucosamine deacetylase
MQFQQTLRKLIEYNGIEFYGGNEVQVRIEPADEDTGIVFVTQRGRVKANIHGASQSRSSILLRDGRAKVINVEHILATLFAYGVDNAVIKLKKIPTRSFRVLDLCGLATSVEVVPVLPDREWTLCNKIEEAGLERQTDKRKLLYLLKEVPTGLLKFTPTKEGLIIRATTDYSVPGKQSAEFEITPRNYRDELARARPYEKHLPLWVPLGLMDFGASLFYPTFGIGHGFSSENVFLPVRTREEWEKQERYHGEIARHSIVDRLGAISLLEGRLEGVMVYANRSGQRNDIQVLQAMSDGKFFAGEGKMKFMERKPDRIAGPLVSERLK